MIAAAFTFVVLLSLATSALAASFNPNLIISDTNMRDSGSMSQASIQAFLNAQKGPLKSLVIADYAGKKKPASQIIFEACRQWHISPRVMLTMLQKEQSLLTRTTLLSNTLDRAVGAGCPGGPANKYPGFGNQIWNGARLLDGYGEGKNGSTVALFYPGIYWDDIYQHPNVRVYAANIATYKLYVYNPSIGAKTPYGDLSAQSSNISGNANFWVIYRKNFGDPLAAPLGYHTRVTITRNTQLWNGTIHSKRNPSPKHPGIVNVTGPVIVRHGRKYIPISWGGNRAGGWVRYDHVKWV